MPRMVQRTWGVLVCALYMGWASLAIWILVGSWLFTGPQIRFRYSPATFLAFHPAIPLASIPAMFRVGRTPSMLAFVGLALLSGASAFLLFNLRELGRQLARLMSVLGILAVLVVAYSGEMADILVITALIAPYALIFFYLGRDYVELRFQLAKGDWHWLPKFFRPDD